MLKKIVLLILGIMLLAGTSLADVQLTGAGATFPYPIYSKWFHQYNQQKPGIKINYQSIGNLAENRGLRSKAIPILSVVAYFVLLGFAFPQLAAREGGNDAE